MAHILEDHPTPSTRSSRFLSIAGLAVFAIGLPLARLLADSPEFFIAHGINRGAALAFWGAVLLAAPLALGCVALLPWRAWRPASTVVLAGLCVLAVLGILQPLGLAEPWATVATLGLASLLVVLERERPVVRQSMGTLVVLALVLGAWVVGPSRSGAYLRSGEGHVVAASIPHDAPPVVVLVFDELPLGALLTSDLRVNAERFPNFADLASTSNWYRLASSVSPQTALSVPALLSGVEPHDGSVSVASAYPTSIFAELGGRYEVHEHQPITDLCPKGACAKRRAPSARGSFLADLGVLLGQGVGPASLRDRLPDVSHGWAGFAASEGARSTSDRTPSEDANYGTFTAEARELLAVAEDPSETTKPQLFVAHVIAPHMPWVALPDMTPHGLDKPTGMRATNGTLVWEGTELDRARGYQRLVLQLGGLDRALGEARRALEERHLWDDAAVVVTADHGVQFNPGAVRGLEPGGVEVTGVPLFVKAPGQRSGRVVDDAALTIDLVPTVLGLVGAHTPSVFDGRDLLAGGLPTERTDAFLAAPGTWRTPDQSRRSLQQLVKTRDRWLDADGDWNAAYQVEVDRRVVGRSVASMDPVVARDGGLSLDGPSKRAVQGIEVHDLPSSARWVGVACGGEVVGAISARGLSGRVDLLTVPGRCDGTPRVAVIGLASGRVQLMEDDQ